MSETDQNAGGERMDRHVLVIALLVMVLLALAVIANKFGEDKNVASKNDGNALVTKESAIDKSGWTTAVDPLGEERVIANFIMSLMPQCISFHYKTINEGEALGLRCFEKVNDEERISYFFLYDGTAQFIGPFKTEDDMLQAIQAGVKPEDVRKALDNQQSGQAAPRTSGDTSQTMTADQINQAIEASRQRAPVSGAVESAPSAPSAPAEDAPEASPVETTPEEPVTEVREGTVVE